MVKPTREFLHNQKIRELARKITSKLKTYPTRSVESKSFKRLRKSKRSVKRSVKRSAKRSPRMF